MTIPSAPQAPPPPVTGGPATIAPPQTVAVTVQTPPERHDYVADAVSGGIGLFGALAGAYAAYRWGLKAAKDAKDREAKERDNHLSFAVIHKLNRVYSAQKQVRLSIESGVARLASARDRAEGAGRKFLDHLCMEVRPFATTMSRVAFTADEVMAAGRMGGEKALQIVMILDERHNTTAELLDQYRTAKAEFTAMRTLSEKFDPERGYSYVEWTEEQYKAAQPKLYVMDVMIQSLLKHSTQDEIGSYDAVVAILIGRAKNEPKADYRVVAPDGRKMKITSAGIEVMPPDPPEPVQEAAPA